MLFELGNEEVAASLINTHYDMDWAQLSLTSFLYDSKSYTHLLLHLGDPRLRITADITLIDKGTGKTIHLLSEVLKTNGPQEIRDGVTVASFKQDTDLRTWIEGR